MRISAVSNLSAVHFDSGKLTIRQHACGVSAAAQSILLLPILVAVIAPSVMIAAEAIAEPATRDRLAASPVNTIGALVGVAIWLAMFGIPAFSALRRLGWSRSVKISQNTVNIHDRSLLGSHIFNLPLHEFEGISHHVRTNLSGSRHELVLIHPERSKSLLVQMADTISQEETDAFAHQFGLQQLPAGILFRRSPFTLQLHSWTSRSPKLHPDRPDLHPA